MTELTRMADAIATGARERARQVLRDAKEAELNARLRREHAERALGLAEETCARLAELIARLET